MPVTQQTARHPIQQQNTTPVYPSGLSRLPQPLIIEPVAVDAALARLLGPHRTPGTAKPQASRTAPIEASATGWDWAPNDLSGLEVTEHPLPDGLDFEGFHALLRLAH
jgi:hypothetical protein